MPVANYLFFNSGDYFGRILAGLWERVSCKINKFIIAINYNYFQPRDNPHTVLLMTVIRLLYVPFFLCANSNVHNFLPVLVHTDITFIILMISFGITNGYLVNISLIMAPR